MDQFFWVHGITESPRLSCKVDLHAWTPVIKSAALWMRAVSKDLSMVGVANAKLDNFKTSLRIIALADDVVDRKA